MPKNRPICIIVIILILIFFQESTAQQSFPIDGYGDWYQVGAVAGQHAYFEYVYSHPTGHNPPIAKGEIHFINSQNFSIQHHQTMGYSAWNQP